MSRNIFLIFSARFSFGVNDSAEVMQVKSASAIVIWMLAAGQKPAMDDRLPLNDPTCELPRPNHRWCPCWVIPKVELCLHNVDLALMNSTFAKGHIPMKAALQCLWSCTEPFAWLMVQIRLDSCAYKLKDSIATLSRFELQQVVPCCNSLHFKACCLTITSHCSQWPQCCCQSPLNLKGLLINTAVGALRISAGIARLLISDGGLC